VSARAEASSARKLDVAALALAGCALGGALGACGDTAPAPKESTSISGTAASARAAPGGASPNAKSSFVSFRERGAAAGVTFVHRSGARGRRVMIEQLGSGVAVFDYDGDGKQDLYFVDSGELPARTEEQAPGGNKLFRNLGDWKFADVTANSGAAGRGYMHGAVVGDYDGDGDIDLYVTAYGSNSLLQNQGDGTFRDVTQQAGCDDRRWSTGAAFLDYDRDGVLDLFVQNYVEFRVEQHRPYSMAGVDSYSPPDLFEPVACSLFRGRGDGTFENVSARTGLVEHVGKGLGVLVGDLDDDGSSEIYCANDSTPNRLLVLKPDGRFEDLGLVSGSGYGADGREEAGMGVDAGDVNGDARLDIVVTNFQKEPNALYRNEGELNFTEISERSGTASAARRSLGFGVRLADFDHDGRLDLVVNNGHVYDNAPLTDPPATWAQAPLLFRGLANTRFEDVLATQPPEFQRARVGRGLAAGDLDDDGDLDLVLTSAGGKAEVFENAGGEQGAWLTVRCVGTQRDSTAIGARVEVLAGGVRRLNDVRSGGSYLSQSDLRVHFGFGDLSQVERVSVRWPDGAVEEARDVPTRRHLVFVEGQGLQPQ
jgi:hypothetical protein